MVKLGEWEGRSRYEPRYDDPAFQSAFQELVDLLADAIRLPIPTWSTSHPVM